jgi:hypothetical protein
MTPHLDIVCASCGLPTRYPFDTLQRLFLDPDIRPNDSLAVALACQHCKSLETCFLDRKHPLHNKNNRVWLLEIRGADPVHVNTLECGERSCELLLPLFAYWNPASTEEERRADIATWRWSHLKCPAGHSIPEPLSWTS